MLLICSGIIVDIEKLRSCYFVVKILKPRGLEMSLALSPENIMRYDYFKLFISSKIYILH
jgi:hypothetical protein